MRYRARTPNPYLSLEIEEPDLFARTARLFALSRGFVVLGGGAGTLAELAALWAHARARVLPGPIILLDDGWPRCTVASRRTGASRHMPHAPRGSPPRRRRP